MIARGKREARRPWLTTALRSRPERPKYSHAISPFQGSHCVLDCLPGATRFALAPGYHIPRRWRCEFIFRASRLPLAIIFRAVGAANCRQNATEGAGERSNVSLALQYTRRYQTDPLPTHFGHHEPDLSEQALRFLLPSTPVHTSNPHRPRRDR